MIVGNAIVRPTGDRLGVHLEVDGEVVEVPTAVYTEALKEARAPLSTADCPARANEAILRATLGVLKRNDTRRLESSCYWREWEK